MAPPQGRPIHTRFTDPNATDSDTDSNLDSLERCQPKRLSKTIVEATTAVVSPLVKKRKRTKKGEEKAEMEVTTAVVSSPVKNRKRNVSRPPVHPQSFVSKGKQRNDIPSDNPTSAADIRTGSTSSVHNISARPPGIWEDLSSQLLKQQEALTDADLRTGDFDSENVLIHVDHLSTWPGNLNWDENLLFKK